MTDTSKITQADLQQFTGTETWYRHGLARKILYTEGAQFVAERGGAYWLLDEIALVQQIPPYTDNPFQVWKLIVNADRTALLTCEDGNGGQVSAKVIDYTDFPLPDITLWFSENVILLPSEW